MARSAIPEPEPPDDFGPTTEYVYEVLRFEVLGRGSRGLTGESLRKYLRLLTMLPNYRDEAEAARRLLRLVEESISVACGTGPTGHAALHLFGRSDASRFESPRFRLSLAASVLCKSEDWVRDVYVDLILKETADVLFEALSAQR